MGLTARERQVLTAIRVHRARSSKAIAKRLGVSVRTVEDWLASITRKLPATYEPDAKPFLRVLLYALRTRPLVP